MTAPFVGQSIYDSFSVRLKTASKREAPTGMGGLQVLALHCYTDYALLVVQAVLNKPIKAENVA